LELQYQLEIFRRIVPCHLKAKYLFSNFVSSRIFPEIVNEQSVRSHSSDIYFSNAFPHDTFLLQHKNISCSISL
jgi:hypothetical protein